jgi:hypothetical protein
VVVQRRLERIWGNVVRIGNQGLSGGGVGHRGVVDVTVIPVEVDDVIHSHTHVGLYQHGDQAVVVVVFVDAAVGDRGRYQGGVDIGVGRDATMSGTVVGMVAAMGGFADGT